MPILFEGKHICEKCRKTFNWVYFETTRTHMGSSCYIVEQIPNEPKARRVAIIDEKTREVFIDCPHCGFGNEFVDED